MRLRVALNKLAIKQVLGELPLTAELYWQLRQAGRPLSKSFSLRRTEKRLPLWKEQAAAAQRRYGSSGKKVVIFTTLRYWIEHGTLLAIGAAGLGNQVTLVYLPYANWKARTNRFDMRRHNAYSQKVLQQAAPLLNVVSLYELASQQPTFAANSRGENALPVSRQVLPEELADAVESLALRDVQYSLNLEQVDLQRLGASRDLFLLRLERNLQAAQAALHWLSSERPDVLLTPNGSILEMGAFYLAARHLGIPVVTYEFGEQRDRIWLAQNAEVMRQETDAMWQARGELPLSPDQWQQVRDLFASRRRADLWQNFSRRWQGQPGEGGEKIRSQLGLDSRPVVVLAANVIGDSLTLNRQVFTDSMTDWLQRTVRHFAGLTGVQLVVRIHPGERYTQGPSVAEVVNQALAGDKPGAKLGQLRADHILLVGAGDPINTYDLLEIADLGLVYTTTVGMEMAMSGVPTVVAGQTHYRGRGFSFDPQSWQEYEQILTRLLADPAGSRLPHQQVEAAWSYAYRFFFEYPRPFPWHLLHFWNELETWSVARVLSDEGQAVFGRTFAELLGEPINWSEEETIHGL